jgi:hypothetical protein
VWLKVDVTEQMPEAYRVGRRAKRGGEVKWSRVPEAGEVI